VFQPAGLMDVLTLAVDLPIVVLADVLVHGVPAGFVDVLTLCNVTADVVEVALEVKLPQNTQTMMVVVVVSFFLSRFSFFVWHYEHYVSRKRLQNNR